MSHNDSYQVSKCPASVVSHYDAHPTKIGNVSGSNRSERYGRGTELMIKKLVDRSGVNKMFKFHLIECSTKVGSELNLDLFMIEDLLDECGVSMF